MKKLGIGLIVVLMLNFMTLAVNAQMVIYNTETGIFHKINCKWAKKCTVNCIKIEKKEAIKLGGTPCKVCGK